MNQVMLFLKNEDGQSMVEYGVVLGAVAAVSYIAVVVLGNKTFNLYAWMANHLPGGDSNATGQVGNGHNHLAHVEADANGEMVFTEGGMTMNEHLGGSSVYTNASGWNS